MDSGEIPIELTELIVVKKAPDELWIAEKFQSNSEIAGSPRNSFRASLDGRIAEVEH